MSKMMFIKNFKLFAICVLGLSMYVQSRSISVSQVGDVHISLSDDKWECDRIECPLDSFRCFVSKSNEKDPSVLVRVDACYTKDNKILARKEFESPADPRSRIRMQITSTRNGNVISAPSGLEDFDEEEFNAQMKEEMDKMHANINAELQGIHENLRNEMKELHANLNQMHKNINSNMHNQMQNLEHNLSNMQNNLAHMFD